MAINQEHKENQNGPNIQPAKEIEILPSDITVSISDQGIERELVYPDVSNTRDIVISTSAETGVSVGQSYQERLLSSIEEVKSHQIDEIGFELGPLKFHIKRSPGRVIRVYRERTEDR